MTNNKNANSYHTVGSKRPCTMNFPVSSGVNIHFPHGIPGFEEVKDYELRSYKQFCPFLFMNAMNDADLGFVCTDIFFLRQDYEANISTQILEHLRCKNMENLALLSIVTVGQTAEETTANLLSPILINMEDRLGMQIILENSNYSIRYPIWENLKKNMNQSNDTTDTNPSDNDNTEPARQRQVEGL